MLLSRGGFFFFFCPSALEKQIKRFGLSPEVLSLGAVHLMMLVRKG